MCVRAREGSGVSYERAANHYGFYFINELLLARRVRIILNIVCVAVKTTVCSVYLPTYVFYTYYYVLWILRRKDARAKTRFIIIIILRSVKT